MLEGRALLLHARVAAPARDGDAAVVEGRRSDRLPLSHHKAVLVGALVHRARHDVQRPTLSEAPARLQRHRVLPGEAHDVPVHVDDWPRRRGRRRGPKRAQAPPLVVLLCLLLLAAVVEHGQGVLDGIVELLPRAACLHAEGALGRGVERRGHEVSAGRGASVSPVRAAHGRALQSDLHARQAVEHQSPDGGAVVILDRHGPVLALVAGPLRHGLGADVALARVDRAVRPLLAGADSHAAREARARKGNPGHRGAVYVQEAAAAAWKVGGARIAAAGHAAHAADSVAAPGEVVGREVRVVPVPVHLVLAPRDADKDVRGDGGKRVLSSHHLLLSVHHLRGPRADLGVVAVLPLVSVLGEVRLGLRVPLVRRQPPAAEVVGGKQNGECGVLVLGRVERHLHLEIHLAGRSSRAPIGGASMVTSTPSSRDIGYRDDVIPGLALRNEVLLHQHGELWVPLVPVLLRHGAGDHPLKE
mmetsp:Transcript_62060/g.165086  ORF Transcript_62060/g.165086 Transcript_62060/m.165086 type:complete len:473 (-) Transcript_62060:401-1819(-)